MKTETQKTNTQPSAARLTPPGRGGVATIQVIGPLENLEQAPGPFFHAINKKPIFDQPINKLVYGYWRDEDVVVSRRDDSIIEIHCHGGEIAVTRILNDLESLGFEKKNWQDQLVENASEFESEYRTALSQVTTQKTASILLRQKNNWESCLLTIKAFEEKNQTTELKNNIETIIGWKDFGRHLVQPWQVVLAGRPNVGKSSLINRLIGYDRTIVHNHPGTTRDAVSAETAFDGWPVTLTDTAGIRETVDDIEKEGVQRAQTHLQNADLLLIVIDRSTKPSEDDLNIIKTKHSNRIILANKSDLEDRWQDLIPADAIPVSAENSDGFETLIEAITERIVPAVPEQNQLIPFTKRQSNYFEEILASLS